MTAADAEKLPWAPHPTASGVQTLKLGHLRLCVTDAKWWSPGPGGCKAVACLSMGGAKLKAVLWAREQAQAVLDAIGGAA